MCSTQTQKQAGARAGRLSPLRAWCLQAFGGTGGTLVLYKLPRKLDRSRLAAGSSQDGGAKGKEVQQAAAFTVATSSVTACCFAPGGQLVFGCEGGSLVLWDTATFVKLRTWTLHQVPITSCAFSGSGAEGGGCLMAVGDRLGYISVWDTEDDTLVQLTQCVASPARARLFVRLACLDCFYSGASWCCPRCKAAGAHAAWPFPPLPAGPTATQCGTLASCTGRKQSRWSLWALRGAWWLRRPAQRRWTATCPCWWRRRASAPRGWCPSCCARCSGTPRQASSRCASGAGACMARGLRVHASHCLALAAQHPRAACAGPRRPAEGAGGGGVQRQPPGAGGPAAAV